MNDESSRPPRSTFDRWLRGIQLVLITLVLLGLTTRGGFREVVGYAGLAVLVGWGAWLFNKAGTPS